MVSLPFYSFAKYRFVLCRILILARSAVEINVFVVRDGADFSLQYSGVGYNLSLIHINEDLDVDFIISTVPLNVSNLPVIHVNQMLSENDIRNMEKQIDKMILSREQKLILNDIQYYLDQYQMLSNKNIIQFGNCLLYTSHSKERIPFFAVDLHIL